jgi:predicted esterase
MAITRPTTTSLIAIFTAGFAISTHVLAQQGTPEAATPQTAPADPWAAGVDPRVEQRTYLFTETNEQLPYALFVSSKVNRREAAPVIVALHGLGGTQNTMVGTRLNTIELAEQGGYIFISPMGYNCGGWYGIPPRAPVQPPAEGARQGAPGQTAANGPPRGAGAGANAGRGGRGGGRGQLQCAGGGTAVTDAARVRELSEKDVLTVLDMIREEFNVDENRIYLMGHSMGGSGTLYLGGKYPELWAAIAADAPPGPGSAEALAESQMPVLVIQGDKDTAVPVANTRRYIERLSELNAAYRYIEIGGLDHNIAGIADMYEFFAEHSKAAP